MNYYKNENHLFDLELNIPIQQSYVYKKSSNDYQTVFANQRKIFLNTTRSLGINAPNLMNFPVNRMDLMFWSNIEYYGNSYQMIS
jgi:GTP cyclohydrolase II